MSDTQEKDPADIADISVKFDPPPKSTETGMEKSNCDCDITEDVEVEVEDEEAKAMTMAAAKKEWEDLNKKFNKDNYDEVNTGTFDMILTTAVQSGMLTFTILFCNVMGRDSNAACHFAIVFGLTLPVVILLQLCKGFRAVFTTWNYVDHDYRRETIQKKFKVKYPESGYNNGFFVPELCVARIFSIDSHGAFGILAGSCLEIFCYFWQINQHLEIPLWLYYALIVFEAIFGYYWHQTATEPKRYRKGVRFPSRIMRWFRQGVVVQCVLVIVFFAFLFGFGFSKRGFGGPEVKRDFVALMIILGLAIAVRTVCMQFVFYYLPDIYEWSQMDMKDDEGGWAWKIMEKFRERFLGMAPSPPAALIENEEKMSEKEIIKT